MGYVIPQTGVGRHPTSNVGGNVTLKPRRKLLTCKCKIQKQNCQADITEGYM